MVGPALATAGAFALVLPILLRTGLRASDAALGDLLRRAMLPAYALGALLAGVLVAIRFGLEPHSLPAVAVTCTGAVLGYWAAFYAFVLTTEERALFRRD